MSQQTRNFLAGAAVLLALASVGPAEAAEVLRVGPDGPHRAQDPLVPQPAGSSLGREPRSGRPSALASAPKGKRKRPTRGARAVSRALTSAARRGRISRASSIRYRTLYARARRVRAALEGVRGRELGAVVATLESIALRRRLTASRMPALFLILRRNTEFWPGRVIPRNRDRVTFSGSELLFGYYAGAGLQLQPLVNFKKANLMHGACVKDTGAQCRREGLRMLLGEMVATSSRRGGFRAWEYFFRFGGGAPPWMSAMAQATGVQAFGRASQLLEDPTWEGYAREALPAFETPSPTGVAARGPIGGTHFLQYSFAPRLFIINAFLQSLIGLYDYAQITGDSTARRLYAAAEPEARAELPRHDTGDWSTYSFGGRESTREYHELLREFLRSLCNRVRERTYCEAAKRFRLYTTEAAQLELLGPATVTEDEPVRVRFSLSKLSAVQITITRAGRTAIDRTATFRRGGGSFAWTPRTSGIYKVRLAAKELRTGLELRTRRSGEIESVPAD